MRYFLFVLLFIFSTQVTTAVAKEEFWECRQYVESDLLYIYKIDTKTPSVSERVNGEWRYYKNLVYNKENQNLSTTDNKGNREVFDLLLKKHFYNDIKFSCKVINFLR